MKCFTSVRIFSASMHSNRAVGVLGYLLLILLSTSVSAQYNIIDWGAYFSDSNFPFTYTDDELIDDIKIDKVNNEDVYVVGRTRSAIGSNIPCAGGTLTYGKGDIAVAKYDRCGNLQWSRYLGNKKKTDYSYTLDLDHDFEGNTILYVAGEMKTNGLMPDAIICDGGPAPFQINPVGSWDGFIAKYSANGDLLRWTYFGGNDTVAEKVDQILGIAVNNHHVFVTGYTESSDLHLGAKVVDDNTFDGAGDGFFAEFSANLDTLMYFSYIGGPGKDRCHGIRIYQAEGQQPDIFLDGTTPSPTGIFAGTGFDNTLGGDLDGFVGKWEDDNLDGKFTKTWCTYLGGTGIERARDMDVDDAGNIMLVGQTASTSISWINGYDLTYNGGTDGFVVKLPNGGGNPMWGTYFGGYANEEAVGLVWKKGHATDHVIIGGITYSSQKATCLPDPNPNNYSIFPLQNPLMPYINGKKGGTYCPGTVGDAFIAEITDVPVGQSLIFSTYIGGTGNEVNGDNQLSYNPSFAIADSGELYIAFNTKSPDIQVKLAAVLEQQFGNYRGGIDGYIARIINTGSGHFNCDTASRLIENEFAAYNPGNIAVYPNPSSQIFNIALSAEEEVTITLRVFDATGKLVLDKKEYLTAGVTQSAIDLENQPDGIYLLQVLYTDQVLHAKLLKQ